jgi:hypothetical protein
MLPDPILHAMKNRWVRTGTWVTQSSRDLDSPVMSRNLTPVFLFSVEKVKKE